MCVRVCCWLLRVYTFYVRGSCSVFAFTILSARYMRIYFECTMMMRHVGNFWCTVRVELHFFENKNICYRPPVNIYSMWWSQRAWWSHPNGCEGNSAVCVWEVNGDIIFVFFVSRVCILIRLFSCEAKFSGDLGTRSQLHIYPFHPTRVVPSFPTDFPAPLITRSDIVNQLS